jgi:hypothetical protein
MPFAVTISNVKDPDLAPLLTYLARAGYQPSNVTPIGIRSSPSGHEPNGTRKASGRGLGDLPASWKPVRTLEGQTYRWPESREHYDPYVVYSANTLEGTVHIALGEAPREKTWGRDRKYVLAFLTSGAPQTPVAEFLEVDDYKESRELLAVIRGRDGGRKMYGPGDSLPDVYDGLEVHLYSDRIKHAGAWNKLAVVAREDDPDTMLNHALIQARRRGDV